MTEAGKYEPPEPLSGDQAHALARAALGLLPFASGTAVELLNAIVAPPLEKRRLEWMESVASGLRALENKKGMDIEKLSTNEAFIDTVLQATVAAVGTSRREKLEALRNAVLNSALPGSPNDSIRSYFLSIVEDLSVAHIQMLALFDDPPRWFQNRNLPSPATGILAGGLMGVVQAAYPDLAARREFADQVAKDLSARGLLGVNGLGGMMSGSSLMAKRTTDLGSAFLSFITKPEGLD
jgi:hypothetical protein